MDCIKVGNLIKKLRKEKNMTQKQLSDEMNISDKTISKWERGLGCPDVSLLGELSKIFKVNIDKILSGEMDCNMLNGGNMKKIKFYACPTCGNITTSLGEAEISCCGRILAPLTPKKCDEEHNIKIENIDNELYITFSHEMTKEHYISFVAYVTYDRVYFVKLYPEQGGEVRLPLSYKGKILLYCNNHGLYSFDK